MDQARVLLGGGIGSGKSTAGSVFDLRGAAVLSADRAAHRALITIARTINDTDAS